MSLGFDSLMTNPHHIVPCQLICNINKLTGFYMVEKNANGLISINFIVFYSFIARIETGGFKSNELLMCAARKNEIL